MARPRSPLDLVTIASPCTASWDAMKGDDRRRLCEACHLHVYDVSNLTRVEAEALLLGTPERPGRPACMRLWRRADGTVITKDCGRVLLAIERRLWWVRTAAAAILGLIGLGGCVRAPKPVPPPGMPGTPPAPMMTGTSADPVPQEPPKPEPSKPRK